MKNNDFISTCQALSILYDELKQDGLYGIGPEANRVQLSAEKYIELFGETDRIYHNPDHNQMRTVESGVTYFTLVAK